MTMQYRNFSVQYSYFRTVQLNVVGIIMSVLASRQSDMLKLLLWDERYVRGS